MRSTIKYMKRTQYQNGIGAVAIIVIVALLAGAGYFVFRAEPKAETTSETTGSSQASNSSTAASSENPILGTEWTWKYSLLPNYGTTTITGADKFVVTFNHDLRVNSTTDCNTLTGSFVVNGEVLSLSPLASTKKGCADSYDSEYAKQLSLTTSYVIKGDELNLILAKDAGTMVFTRHFKGEKK